MYFKKGEDIVRMSQNKDLRPTSNKNFKLEAGSDLKKRREQRAKKKSEANFFAKAESSDNGSNFNFRKSNTVTFADRFGR